MLQHKFSKEQWLSFIQRLNDRALIKNRQTGFTTYALFGFLIIIINDLITILPTVIDEAVNGQKIILLVITLLNVIYALNLILISILLKINPPSRIRFFPDLLKHPYSFYKISLGIIMFLVALSNIYIALHKGFILMQYWYFYVFGAFLFLDNVFINFIKYIKRRLNWGNQSSNLPMLQINTMFIQNQSRMGFIIYHVFFGTALLIIGLLPLISMIIEHNILVETNIIKLSLELIALIFIFLILIFNITISQRCNSLIALETNIMIDNPDVDTIREYFIRDYLGPTARELLQNIEKIISELYRSFSDSLSLAEKSLDEFIQSDINSKHDTSAKMRSSHESLVLHYKNFITFNDVSLKLVDHLVKERAFINDDDIFQSITFGWVAIKNKIEINYKNHIDKYEDIKI